MTYEDIVKEWNDGADNYNQWTELSEDEKVRFAYHTGTKETKEADAEVLLLKKELEQSDFVSGIIVEDFKSHDLALRRLCRLSRP